MSQNNDVSANQNEETLQAPVYHDFAQSSIQHTNDHNEIEQSYVQVPSNQHVLNQSDMYSATSFQQTNEYDQIQQSYVQVPPNQHVLNQSVMYSALRPMLNSFAGPSFIMEQNLPPQGYNMDFNRAITPPINTHNFRTSYMKGGMPESSRGSSSHSGGEAISNEPMENHQYPNAPPNIDPPRNPQIIPNYNNPYDSRYAENGLPEDPFLRHLKLNPNFDNTGGNN